MELILVFFMRISINKTLKGIFRKKWQQEWGRRDILPVRSTQKYSTLKAIAIIFPFLQQQETTLERENLKKGKPIAFPFLVLFYFCDSLPETFPFLCIRKQAILDCCLCVINLECHNGLKKQRKGQGQRRERKIPLMWSSQEHPRKDNHL